MNTRAARVIGLITLALAVLIPVLVGLGTPSAERTFVSILGPTQTLISVTVPFLGVLAVHALLRPAPLRAIGLAILIALLIAIAYALLGVATSASVTLALPSAAPGGRWTHSASVVLGSVLVQSLAQLVGTGFGLLVRRTVLACTLTIVLPLGAWLLFGTVPPLEPAQAFLAPFSSAQHLLGGPMAATYWAQWLVMVAIWGVGLNLLGAWRASRSDR